MARWTFSAASIAARLRASPCIVDPGAAAGPARRAAAEQGRAQRRRRRRIADSHLADGQQVAIVGHRAVAGIDRGEEFVRRSSPRPREIARRPLEVDRHHCELGSRGLAIWLMAAPPAVKLATICAVTAGG